MDVTNKDRIFYTAALEYVTERIETLRSFLTYNGVVSLPGEEITDLFIVSLKRWLLSEAGEHWLHSLGYYHSVTFSGCLSNLDMVCPVCSGTFNYLSGSTCERCGRNICQTCTSVVDNHYHLEWCEHCMGQTSLSNIVPHIR
jgi:hypothetical protein